MTVVQQAWRLASCPKRQRGQQTPVLLQCLVIIVLLDVDVLALALYLVAEVVVPSLFRLTDGPEW